MYCKHFGLNELPFSTTPNPRFVYKNARADEALGKLRYGIEAKKGFFLLTGEAGTGKTTLLRLLMRSFSDGVAYAYIFNPRLKFSALLRAILKDLGIPTEVSDKESMLERLNVYALEQHQRGRIVACILDEAQGLSDDVLEELRLLGNLETDNEKLVQIILAGQPELERRLDQVKLRQFKQRISIRHVLNPLQANEVGPYLAARLGQAGYNGGQLFGLTVVERINYYSRGIPRLINAICDTALVRAWRSGTREITVKLIDEAAIELRLLVPSQEVLPGRLASAGQQADGKVPGSGSISENAKRRDNAVSGDRPGAARLYREFEMPSGAPALARRTRLERIAIGTLVTVIVSVLVGVALLTPRVDGGPANIQLSRNDMRGLVPAVAAPSNSPTINPDSAGAKASLPTPRTSDQPPVKHAPTNVNEFTRPTAVEARKTVPSPSHAVLRVSATSFLRDRPAADAEIIDSLRPGIRVEVTNVGGEYFRVRALGNENVQGFVHKEDAFFEPFH
jgi:general secretion pathway protein A